MFPPIRHHTFQPDDPRRDPRTHLVGAPPVWLMSSLGRKPKRGETKSNQTHNRDTSVCVWYVNNIHRMDVVGIHQTFTQFSNTQMLQRASRVSPTYTAAPRSIQKFFKHYRPETIPCIWSSRTSPEGESKHIIVARGRYRAHQDLQLSKVLQMVPSVDDTAHVQIYRHACNYKHI